ncbi:MAG: WbqC family protein [Candidatus Cyclobacteriaceae bacterium M2_1C_046]
MKEIIIDLQFLPPIEYFTCLAVAEKVHLELNEHYEKQTYRNRCYIRGANKVERLSIPVIAGNHTAFKNVRISYEPDWVNHLWRSVNSAYANAPFYIYFAEDFKNIFFNRPEYLYQLNKQLLTLCLKLLNLDVNISYTKTYEKNVPENIQDLRSIISPKQRYTGRPFYKPKEYPQIFGSNFEANLSVLDLIFCEGPTAGGIVTKSIHKE